MLWIAPFAGITPTGSEGQRWDEALSQPVDPTSPPDVRCVGSYSPCAEPSRSAPAPRLLVDDHVRLRPQPADIARAHQAGVLLEEQLEAVEEQAVLAVGEVLVLDALDRPVAE